MQCSCIVGVDFMENMAKMPEIHPYIRGVFLLIFKNYEHDTENDETA